MYRYLKNYYNDIIRIKFTLTKNVEFRTNIIIMWKKFGNLKDGIEKIKSTQTPNYAEDIEYCKNKLK